MLCFHTITQNKTPLHLLLFSAFYCFYPSYSRHQTRMQGSSTESKVTRESRLHHHRHTQRVTFSGNCCFSLQLNSSLCVPLQHSAVCRMFMRTTDSGSAKQVMSLEESGMRLVCAGTGENDEEKRGLSFSKVLCLL